MNTLVHLKSKTHTLGERLVLTFVLTLDTLSCYYIPLFMKGLKIKSIVAFNVYILKRSESIERKEILYLCTLQSSKGRLILFPCAQAVISHALPQSLNAMLSLPIKVQSTNQDGGRHRITSNILSNSQAHLCQPQISLQIEALKM